MKARRLTALIRKEGIQVVRDPSSIIIAFILPMVLLILFGHGVSLDPSEARVAVVVENRTPETQSFVAAFDTSAYFAVTEVRHRAEALPGLIDGRFVGAVVLAEDFSQRLHAGREAPIQVILDGTEANTAKLIDGYARGVWASWLALRAAEGRSAAIRPIALEPHVWFNPELRSRNFLIPGLIAVIMTLVGALLTALVVAREWERGTMEALMATQASVGEILIGKLLPYFALGMGGMAVSVGMGITVFEVPLEGSFLTLAGVSAAFLVSALAMGLLISSATRNQFAAGQIAIVSAFLPSFMLSGFVFEIASMPAPIQAITYVVSARYFVTSLQTVFLAGDVWAVIVPNTLAMLAIAAVFLALVARRTRKRLD